MNERCAASRHWVVRHVSLTNCCATGAQRCYRRKLTAMEFSKNKSEMGGRRDRGFAHYSDRGKIAIVFSGLIWC